MADTTNTKQPVRSILEQVRNDPRYSQARSVDWFKSKIKELGGNSPSVKTELFNTTKSTQTTRFLPGSMYIFKYDPKYKDTLPFYDTHPCSVMFAMDATSVTGINFHYLSYTVRGKLIDKLLQFSSSKNSKEQILKITWQFLNNISKFPEITPAIKKYRLDHIRSKLIMVPVDQWKISVMLPIESFAKKSLSYVTRSSGQQILRNSRK